MAPRVSSRETSWFGTLRTGVIEKLREAGVDYWVYEMPADASTMEVMTQVKKLNMSHRIHGILIQRPLPQQLNEAKIMGYIDPLKNIEEYDKGQADNIAADALIRLLARYGLLESAQQAKIQIAGFGNIITKEFIKQMKRQFPYVSASKDFDTSYDASTDKHEAPQEEVQAPRASMVISELHRGPGFIKESMVKPESVMNRGEKVGYTNTSSIDDEGLKCPKPNTSQEAGSRRTRAKSKPARWWEGLYPPSSKSMASLDSTSSEEENFPQFPIYPAEAEARTLAIDQYLAAESQRSKQQLKVVVFGDEHEKSLFLKQTRLLELPLSNEERVDVRVETRRFVASICRECLQIVDEYACKPEWINTHPVLGRVKEILSSEEPEDEDTVESMVSLYCDDDLRLALKQSGYNPEDIERRFLNDRFPHILTCPCTANGNLSTLLKRVFTPEFVPTEHDWFHFDQRRLGRVVQEALVHRDTHTLQLLQITDRSTQRRKWIHIVVDDAACLLFICDLAVYDQSLLEDGTITRLHEYLILFDSLVNSRWFTQTPFFVVLSNVSAFGKRILQSPLSNWFPDFKGGSDGDAALKFLENRFRELAKAEQNVYIHVADIYTAEDVVAAIETMENTSLGGVLKERGWVPVEHECLASTLK
ncbi:putative G alpha chain [Fusarium sp. NRRL 52700]|nr:putative G alpha chain [Fusarium sp. NRRL 52700]